MVRWLRESRFASYILLIVRVYLGWQWATGGWDKLVGNNGPFDASGFLKSALKKAGGDHPIVSSGWGEFIENFALPNVTFFNYLIPWAEFLVGIGLILGCLATASIFFAMVMNFSFLLSGMVTYNAEMLLLSFFVIVAGSNAGRVGLDRWVIPSYQIWWANIRKREHLKKE